MIFSHWPLVRGFVHETFDSKVERFTYFRLPIGTHAVPVYRVWHGNPIHIPPPPRHRAAGDLDRLGFVIRGDLLGTRVAAPAAADGQSVHRRRHDRAGGRDAAGAARSRRGRGNAAGVARRVDRGRGLHRGRHGRDQLGRDPAAGGRHCAAGGHGAALDRAAAAGAVARAIVQPARDGRSRGGHRGRRAAGRTRRQQRQQRGPCCRRSARAGKRSVGRCIAVRAPSQPTVEPARRGRDADARRWRAAGDRIRARGRARGLRSPRDHGACRRQLGVPRRGGIARRLRRVRVAARACKRHDRVDPRVRESARRGRARCGAARRSDRSRDARCRGRDRARGGAAHARRGSRARRDQRERGSADGATTTAHAICRRGRRTPCVAGSDHRGPSTRLDARADPIVRGATAVVEPARIDPMDPLAIDEALDGFGS